MAAGWGANSNPTSYNAELKAYTIQTTIIEGSYLRYEATYGFDAAVDFYLHAGEFKTKSTTYPVIILWFPHTTDSLIKGGIDILLAVPSNLGGYGVNPSSPGLTYPVYPSPPIPGLVH
jgi:hypothetical protein